MCVCVCVCVEGGGASGKWFRAALWRNWILSSLLPPLLFFFQGTLHGCPITPTPAVCAGGGQLIWVVVGKGVFVAGVR